MDIVYTVQVLSLAQVRDLYARRMPEDFPPDEIKPLAVIERAMSEGRYTCYGYFEGDAIPAYAFFVVHKNIALLDYYAVARELRSRGIGSRFMQALIAGPLQALDMTLLESEDPACARDAVDLATRSRRLQFYMKNGLTDTGVRATVFHVPYVVLSLPIGAPPTPEAAHSAYIALYRFALPERVFKAMVIMEPRQEA